MRDILDHKSGLLYCNYSTGRPEVEIAHIDRLADRFAARMRPHTGSYRKGSSVLPMQPKSRATRSSP